MLKLEQVSQWLNVHPNTVRRWVKNGRLHCYQLSSRGDLRFEEEDVRKFLDESNLQFRTHSETEYSSLLSK